jgi:hypothetical protein
MARRAAHAGAVESLTAKWSLKYFLHLSFLKGSRVAALFCVLHLAFFYLHPILNAIYIFLKYSLKRRIVLT